MVWPNDTNKNSAKRPSGAKETPNRAAVEAIADAIEKDIYGQDKLTIQSCSKYAVEGYNTWSKNG
jgi:ribonuclease HI